VKRTISAVVLCCALAGLTGCGSSASSSSSSAVASSSSTAAVQTSTQASTTTAASNHHHRRSHGGKGNTASSSQTSTTTSQSSDAGNGGGNASASTQGYGSLGTFGHEANGEDRAAVLAAFHSYLAAIGAGNWAVACQDISDPIKHQLQVLVSKVKSLARHGCAAALGAILGRTPAAIRRKQEDVTVVGVRTDGEHAFVLYSNALTPHATISMIRQDGRWTAGVIAAAPVG
jgi:hypothetical protein